MRCAVLFLILATAAVSIAETGLGAQAPVHDRHAFPSMTFLPQGPNPLVPPKPPAGTSDKALEALTKQKLAEPNAPQAPIDCQMVRDAGQGVDPRMPKPATLPGGPSFLGRVVTMPSCARK